MYSRTLILLGLTSVFSLVVGNESTYSKCADNMHYMQCGSGCPRTCADVNNTHKQKHICEMPSKSGCFCNEGFVLQTATSKHCIPQSECKKSCQANAQYKNCSTACPVTCDNYSNPPKTCTRQCMIGCACKDGYVLESATSKKCICPSECKKPCLDNAQYKACGTACPLTCDNYDNPPACKNDCVHGCFCNEGYVLPNATSKNCIPQSDCRKICKENAHYMQCGTACPLTCNNYANHSKFCTMQCVPGCVCDDGYVLENESSDLCVHKTACKSPCQANAHYEECGTTCPKNCADVTMPTLRPCTLQCKPGCFCNEGYALENAASMVCVNESICKACEAHSHFSTCASACPLNCQNYKKQPTMCMAMCLSGCVCDEGYIFKFGESGPCVCSSEC